MKPRLAIVFGVSSGGVQYTRRFYEQIVKQGANAASPLLFPETVYNAPASHLAAMLGVDGATYTLVGDGTVGLQALEFGAQLIAAAEAHGESQGCYRIQLTSNNKRTDAHRFYLRLGYSQSHQGFKKPLPR
ncbi:MAG: GNAT family N-acetyltransferase [Actinomycetes bacterium]